MNTRKAHSANLTIQCLAEQNIFKIVYINLLEAQTETLLFFAAYVLSKKKYLFSRVVFLFSQTKIANFLIKKNDIGRLRTTRFSSSRFGVRVTVLPNNFMIYPEHFSIPETNETLKGFPYEIFRHCETKSFRRKILIPPLLSQHFPITETFWNTEGFLDENFRQCETKTFQEKVVIPFCIKYRNQWWNWLVKTLWKLISKQ